MWPLYLHRAQRLRFPYKTFAGTLKGKPHMNLESQLAAVRDQNLTLDERAELACRLAKKLEKTGEYEAACEALNEFWSDRYQPPRLEELDEPTQAELLLRVGALAGWQAP